MTDRLALLRRVMVLGLALLVLRLAFMQLVRGGAYRQLADHNRLRLIPQPATRGLFVDREGRRLAANREQFRVAVIPQDVLNRRTTMTRLGPLVGLPPGELDWRFDEDRQLPFLPATLVAGVPKLTALRVEEAHLDLPGIVVERPITRAYPLGSVAAALLGYVGLPDPDALPALKPYGISPQELVGRAGLERALDAYLRGRAGGSLIEVDHRARQVRVVGHREPLAGVPVTLTIDARLQALIEGEFARRQQPGACVVLKPQTGEVLAMTSFPTVDPEAFATQDAAAIGRFFRDPRAPLMNRATDGTYLPGSILKPLTAMLALERGVATPTTVVRCPGFLTIGNRKFHCWNRDGHGPMTMREALRSSCNVYFMEVGRRLGAQPLRAGFAAIGFGRRTGWLMEEQAGYLPLRVRLSEGEVALLAMGQGDVLITPLQAAVLAAALANQGWAMEPWVVKAIGEVATARVPARPLGWSPAHLAVVQEGMRAVVEHPEGTGARARSERVSIVGKTGTAQTHLRDRPHGWFIGFCPAQQPVAAMAVLAEHGGSGGDFPAEVARLICEAMVSG